MTTTAAPCVPFAVTEIVPEAQQAALDVLSSGWVTTGPQTAAFESELGSYLGAQHVVAVASCTAAIELVLRAFRLPEGAPVLTPSLTFCGAVQAILHAGLQPVFVDVEHETLLPSPATVRAAIRRYGPVEAMVVQDMAGYPADVDALAEAVGLPASRVVEDAAHGLGATLRGRAVGAGPHAACLSFYATKNLPIGEGGAIATGDEELAETLRQTRLHGMSRDAWRRYLPGGSWRYDVEVSGLKANLTDLQAAIGRAQLKHLPEWQSRRLEIANRYDAALGDVVGLRLPHRPEHGTHAWHLYQIRVLPSYGLNRDQLIEALNERGIGTSVHFIPAHTMTRFAEFPGGLLPVTEAAFNELLSLPMHPGLSYGDIDMVATALHTLGPSRSRRP